jgi:hypothetical protein
MVKGDRLPLELHASFLPLLPQAFSKSKGLRKTGLLSPCLYQASPALLLHGAPYPPNSSRRPARALGSDELTESLQAT